MASKVNANGAWVDANGKSMMHRVVSRRHPEKDPVEVMDLPDSDSGSSSGGNSSNSGNTGQQWKQF